MTDQEINEAVARKLGWTLVAGSDNRVWLKDGDPVNSVVIPDYCHSLEAAWQIWEKLRDMGYDLQLFSSWNRRNIVCFNLTFKGDISKNYQAEAEADTAPRAIVKAFLKVP